MTASWDADLAGLADVRIKARVARRAFDQLAGADQETLDRYVRAMALAGTKAAEELARLAVDETGYGVYEHKIHKNRYNTGFVARWMLERRAVGVLWVDEEARVTAVGSPMGVIAGIIPVTNPTSTALFKCLAAVKSGNAIVLAPHPRAARCTLRTAEIMAEAAVGAGAPEGVISCLVSPTLSSTQELMRQDEIALVLATGGPGTKSFDNGTACVAEQSVVVVDAVADAFLAAFEQRGAYWMNEPQQAALVRILFDERGALRSAAVGQSAVKLAELSGFSVPTRTRVLAATLDRVGLDTPLSREILGPVLSVYRVPDAAAGWARCREVLALDGEGHTCAVHAADPEEIAPFGTLPAGRIVINTPALFGGMGFSCEVDPSFQLGTGTWSGSICSDNVTPLHLINIKRIAHEVRPWRTVYDPVEL